MYTNLGGDKCTLHFQLASLVYFDLAIPVLRFSCGPNLTRKCYCMNRLQPCPKSNLRGSPECSADT